MNAPKTATPSASIVGGEFAEAQTVELVCETDGAEIYYTVDGSDVTKSKTKYTGAIVIDQTTTLKAKAYCTGSSASDEMSETYTITPE